MNRLMMEIRDRMMERILQREARRRSHAMAAEWHHCIKIHIFDRSWNAFKTNEREIKRNNFRFCLPNKVSFSMNSSELYSLAKRIQRHKQRQRKIKFMFPDAWYGSCSYATFFEANERSNWSILPSVVRFYNCGTNAPLNYLGVLFNLKCELFDLLSLKWKHPLNTYSFICKCYDNEFEIDWLNAIE